MVRDKVFKSGFYLKREIGVERKTGWPERLVAEKNEQNRR